MSLIYGATGSLHLDVIRDAIPHSEERVLLITGAVFMIAGVAFKLGAAPFHMWLPDVYQGAPAPIALFISSAPKLAYFGMAYRLLEMGVGRCRPSCSCSLPAGRSLAGHRQPDGHRAEQPQANAGVLHRLAHRLPADGHRRWRRAGLCRRAVLRTGLRHHVDRCLRCDHRPVARRFRSREHRGLQGAQRPQSVDGRPGAVHHGVAGRHPAVPGVLDQAGGAGRGRQRRLLWLAILGVLCAVVGCFYYLRVIKVMYFDEPVGEAMPRSNDRVLGLVLGVNALALLALGLAWNPIMVWCQQHLRI